MNITEDYVSFEVAKLLKEKGFNELCFRLIREDGEIIEATSQAWNGLTKKQKADFYLCPTHQMAMKWLRESHNLQIQITPIMSRHKDWTFGIYIGFSPLYIDLLCFPTYEEAVEAALKYSLENWI